MTEINRARAIVSPWSRRFLPNYHHLEGIVLTLDVLLIVGTSIAGGMLYHQVILGGGGNTLTFIGAAVVVGSLVVPMLYLRGLYSPIALLDLYKQTIQITLHWAAALAVLTSVAFALKKGEAFSRGATLCFACLGLLMLLASRAFWSAWLRNAIAFGRLPGRRIALVSLVDALETSRIAAGLERHGFDIIKRVSNKGDFDNLSCLEFFESITLDFRGSDAKEIYIAADWARLREILPLLEFLGTGPLPVHIIPDFKTADLVQQPWHPVGTTVAVQVQRAPLNRTERTIKRAFDLAFGFAGLIMLSPVMLITAAAIKLDSSGPIFFRQTRIGFNGLAFRIFKFRTMSVLENGDVIAQARRNDDRITRVGRFLRRSSIDELPQLINLIRGDMSLVGPRPHAMAHDSYYEKLLATYALRQHVKPGLTGWAQVNGYRGETPTVDIMARRVDLDIWYVNHWSIWLDIRIVLRTFVAVIRHRNAW